jgi:hypothetical protein
MSAGTRPSETPTVGATTEPTDYYTYDSANRVQTGPIAGSSGSDSYSYTADGGITHSTTNFTSAAYGQAGELCWTYSSSTSNACSSPPSGATVYSTNADGERTAVTPASGNPESLGWNTVSQQLVCVNTNGSSCSTTSPSVSTTLYGYDGNGLRTSATSGSTTTDYAWGSLGGTNSLLADGTWNYVYVPGNSAPVEQIAPTGSNPAVDLLLSDEGVSIRGVVQLSSGIRHDQLVNYTDYDAYGSRITAPEGATEVGGLSQAQTSLSPGFVGSTSWGYGGGYLDATGLSYASGRYYDSNTNQGISTNPIPFQASQPVEASVGCTNGSVQINGFARCLLSPDAAYRFVTDNLTSSSAKTTSPYGASGYWSLAHDLVAGFTYDRTSFAADADLNRFLVAIIAMQDTNWKVNLAAYVQGTGPVPSNGWGLGQLDHRFTTKMSYGIDPYVIDVPSFGTRCIKPGTSPASGQCQRPYIDNSLLAAYSSSPYVQVWFLYTFVVSVFSQATGVKTPLDASKEAFEQACQGQSWGFTNFVDFGNAANDLTQMYAARANGDGSSDYCRRAYPPGPYAYEQFLPSRSMDWQDLKNYRPPGGLG